MSICSQKCTKINLRLTLSINKAKLHQTMHRCKKIKNFLMRLSNVRLLLMVNPLMLQWVWFPIVNKTRWRITKKSKLKSFKSKITKLWRLMYPESSLFIKYHLSNRQKSILRMEKRDILFLKKRRQNAKDKPHGTLDLNTRLWIPMVKIAQFT